MQNQLHIIIDQAQIPGIAVATTSSTGELVKQTAGVISNDSGEAVKESTIFQAASLSKPVFAYIVLKMVERGEFSRPGETPLDGLDRPLHEICDFGPRDLRTHPNYKLLTVRNILSHQAGLPNWFKNGEPEAYAATAETRFDYSGVAYCFLNEVVEHLAKKPLDELSREVFDDKLLKMSHSSFVPPPEGSVEHTKRAIGHTADGATDTRAPSLPTRANPAASLVTTAEDYAKFLNACLHDQFIRTHMFKPRVSLAGKDQKAMDANVPEETLRQMSWGMGMGLQTADNGDPIGFHWGDNETSRAFTAINLRTNETVVCFTNSANGPMVFKQIAEPVVGDISPTTRWLFTREGYKFNEEKQSNPAADYRGKMEEMRGGDITDILTETTQKSSSPFNITPSPFDQDKS
jgi:CubicO group peptidase (beta-lactamase class C family)